MANFTIDTIENCEILGEQDVIGVIKAIEYSRLIEHFQWMVEGGV